MILHVQLFENGKSLLLIPFDPGVKQFVRIKLLHAVFVRQPDTVAEMQKSNSGNVFAAPLCYHMDTIDRLRRRILCNIWTVFRRAWIILRII